MNLKDKMKSELEYYNFFDPKYVRKHTDEEMWNDFCNNNDEWNCDENDKKLFIEVMCENSPDFKEWYEKKKHMEYIMNDFRN